MPPKKAASQTQQGANKDGKKKKALPKGKGMGGTIGLFEKPVKKCATPAVRSFSRPPACCPQEIVCPISMCCPIGPPACPQTIYLSSPSPCCRY